eukprot:2212045-Pyramimonas_sp.AAC.1
MPASEPFRVLAEDPLAGGRGGPSGSLLRIPSQRGARAVDDYPAPCCQRLYSPGGQEPLQERLHLR